MKKHTSTFWFLLIVAMILAASLLAGLLLRAYAQRTKVFLEGKPFSFSVPDHIVQVELGDPEHPIQLSAEEEVGKIVAVFQNLTLSQITRKEIKYGLSRDYPGVYQIPVTFLTQSGEQAELLFMPPYLQLDGGKWYSIDTEHCLSIDFLLGELGFGC